MLSWLLANWSSPARALLPTELQQSSGQPVTSQVLIVVTHGLPVPGGLGELVHADRKGLSSFRRLFHDLGAIQIEPFYPGVLADPGLRQAINRVFILTLGREADPAAAVATLAREPGIDLVGTCGVHIPHYIPTDPRHSDQWHLEHTRVYEAWDTVRGEATANSIIAIVDAGVDRDHPDLAANIWINLPEDINQNGQFDPGDLNGVDDDGNGFVDDVVGWDFGEDDNDPGEDSIVHGTPVAGAASEVTDNGLQGAAVGFASRLMAVKCFTQGGQLVDAYQAMIYAVDNGATVVNCAWGTLTENPVEQYIITSLWEADALVIASAGAVDGVPMYPAAYEHVLAVSATDHNDVKASFANHGTWVDICAPGVNIWTTAEFDDFAVYSGTSFATAMTAGLAALIRAWDPELDADQTVALIESSAVGIDHLNPAYAGRLGAGRIDCAAWLPITAAPEDPPPSAVFSQVHNIPNPFNAATVISYELHRPGFVRLRVFNLAGQLVTVLVSRWQGRGVQATAWDATGLASGTYFYELQVAGQVTRRKCLLVK